MSCDGSIETMTTIGFLPRTLQKICLAVLILGVASIFAGCIPQLDKRKYAGLQVTVSDIPATLYLDGEYLSETPFKQNDLKPGMYTLKIQPDDANLVPYELPIRLTGGLLTAVVWNPGTRPESSGGVVFELERLNNRQQTELAISSIPDGAIVRINEEDLDFAPVVRTDLTAGKQSISLTLPSYDEQNHTLNLVPGHRLSVLVKMARTAGTFNAGDISGDTADDGTSAPESPTTSPTATASAIRTAQNTPATGNTAARNGASGSAVLTGKKVTILPTGFIQNGEEVVRVRESSSAASRELGFAKVGQSYTYLNESTADWIKIQFNSKPGWISKTYGKLE